MTETVQYLELEYKRLAYVHSKRQLSDERPGVLFCGGFKSDMQGTKASYFQNFCEHNALQFTRFDYRGHGKSIATFEHCTITDWLNDAVDILDHICTGKQIIIGSSMGAWIAILATLARSERIAALLGIAAAPDFTEELIWRGIDKSTRQKLLDGETWQRTSRYDDETPYPIRMPLVESGRQHLILNTPIDIHCPVRLIHGSDDQDVPWELSKRLLDALLCGDTSLTLVKNGDHRLSTKAQLEMTGNLLHQLMASTEQT